MSEEEDPLWRRVVFNEILWVMIAAILVLGVAFHLATSKDETPETPARTNNR